MPSNGVVDFFMRIVSLEYRPKALITSGSGMWFVSTLYASSLSAMNRERRRIIAPPRLYPQSVLGVQARVKRHAMRSLAERNADRKLVVAVVCSLVDFEAVRYVRMYRRRGD